LDRIAIVQDDCIPGETARNMEKAACLIERAAQQGARLVLFPEMYLTGYALGKKIPEVAETVAGPVIAELARMAAKRRICVCMGFPELDPASHNIFNSLVCLSDKGEILTVYRKIQLFDEEKKYFSSGSGIKVVQTPIGRAGLLICFDLEFPELARMNALQDADLLLVATANMQPWGSQQDIYVKARAMENQIFLALANRIGREKNLVFCGGSTVVDPTGRILAAAGSQDAALLIAETDLASISRARSSSVNYLRERRPEVYRSLSRLN
jgi:predicted amidohydrolase